MLTFEPWRFLSFWIMLFCPDPKPDVWVFPLCLFWILSMAVVGAVAADYVSTSASGFVYSSFV